MSSSTVKARLRLLGLGVASVPCLSHTVAAEASIPPSVSIAWPRSGDAFSVSTLIKVKENGRKLRVAQRQFMRATEPTGASPKPDAGPVPDSLQPSVFENRLWQHDPDGAQLLSIP